MLSLQCVCVSRVPQIVLQRQGLPLNCSRPVIAAAVPFGKRRKRTPPNQPLLVSKEYQMAPGYAWQFCPSLAG